MQGSYGPLSLVGIGGGGETDGDLDGALVFEHACKLRLEGTVSKRLGSRYRSGRSPDWSKSKNGTVPLGPGRQK